MFFSIIPDLAFEAGGPNNSSVKILSPIMESRTEIGYMELYRGYIGLGILSPIMENQTEKNMEHEMESGVIQGSWGLDTSFSGELLSGDEKPRVQFCRELLRFRV